MDVSAIIDKVKGKAPSADMAPAEGDMPAEGDDHKAKIQAAMQKIQEGMADLQDCLDEY